MSTQPVPPSPRRPWFKKKRFVLPAAALAGIIAVSTLNQPDQSTSTARPEASPSTPASPAAASPATTAEQVPSQTEARQTEETEETKAGNYDEAFGAFAAATKTGRGDGIVTVPAAAKAAVVRATHKGSSNFSIQALDKSNQQVDLLVNTIGAYTGTTSLGLQRVSEEPPSKLKVSADGSWTVTLTPIGTAPAWTTSMKSKGDGVFRYELPAADWKLTHAGQSNFSVNTYGSDTPDLLVNEIGKYNGVVPVREGPQIVVVQADGSWIAARQ